MRKDEIRRMVWELMLKEGVALPPLPPFGRIPNFKGADLAARKLSELEEWRRAKVVKINPDSPQRPVRIKALSEDKVLLMPTPRIRSGFILLDPSTIPKSAISEASTIRGAFRWGRVLKDVDSLIEEVRKVDLIVEGSVAVDVYGNRLGKGEGYGELEYAILLELGIIDRNVPIVTTVHDIQVLSHPIPRDPYDIPVDIIVTPTKVIRVRRRGSRPKGLILELLPEHKVREIPILREVVERIITKRRGSL
jgi:5-formyltetrahydrofolate cyclo-ligase